MIGWVYVMGASRPSDLAERRVRGRHTRRARRQAVQGSCLRQLPSPRWQRDAVPAWWIWPAKTVELRGRNQRVVADDDYLRESILNPQAKIVKGYQPIMPTFQGLLTEDQLLQLIEYVKFHGQDRIRSLASQPTAAKKGGPLNDYRRTHKWKLRTTLHQNYGIRVPAPHGRLTKRIASSLSARHFVLLFPRRGVRRDDPKLELLTPEADLFQSETYNRAVHHAWGSPWYSFS